MSLAFIPDQFSHGEYGFQKADMNHLPRLRQWLAAPHLSGWWVPGEDILLTALAGQAGQAAYMVDHLGMLFAFLYVADPAHDPELNAQIDYPKGSIRFDQFIGDGDMVGHGHGVKFIKAFVAAMKAAPGINHLMAMPEKTNMFAQRTYSQAGLRTERPFEYDGRAFLLMSLSVA